MRKKILVTDCRFCAKKISEFSPDEQEIINNLQSEYYYDIKKVDILNKLDRIDEQTLQNEDVKKDFTPEEISKIKDIADRFSFNDYVRFRNDHYISHDKSTNVKTRTTRANMVHLQFASH